MFDMKLTHISFSYSVFMPNTFVPHENQTLNAAQEVRLKKYEK